jgi:hypothetical protein
LGLSRSGLSEVLPERPSWVRRQQPIKPKSVDGRPPAGVGESIWRSILGGTAQAAEAFSKIASPLEKTLERTLWRFKKSFVGRVNLRD